MNKQIEQYKRLAEYIANNISSDKDKIIYIGKHLKFYNSTVTPSLKNWFWYQLEYYDVKVNITPDFFRLELPEHISIIDFNYEWLLGDIWNEVKAVVKKDKIKVDGWKEEKVSPALAKDITELLARYAHLKPRDIKDVKIEVKSSKIPRF